MNYSDVFLVYLGIIIIWYDVIMGTLLKQRGSKTLIIINILQAMLCILYIF